MQVVMLYFCVFFFFQAEDGIRDLIVTGVQTCALPIWRDPADERRIQRPQHLEREPGARGQTPEIGRGRHGDALGVVPRLAPDLEPVLVRVAADDRRRLDGGDELAGLASQGLRALEVPEVR